MKTGTNTTLLIIALLAAVLAGAMPSHAWFSILVALEDADRSRDRQPFK